jgi:hypothetical protein
MDSTIIQNVERWTFKKWLKKKKKLFEGGRIKEGQLKK